MQAYRDQYARVFNDGEGVTLIGISTDSAEELASWADDEDFQFMFGSDPASAAYSAFGGDPRDNGMVGSRAKVSKLLDQLALAVSETQRRRMHGPAGLDIGAIEPEEIALSILGEIVRERRQTQRAASPEQP